MNRRKKRAFFRNRGRVPHQAPRPMSAWEKMLLQEYIRAGNFPRLVRRPRANHG